MQLTFADIPILFAAGWFELIAAIVFILYSIGHALLNRENAPKPRPKQPRPQGNFGPPVEMGPQGHAGGQPPKPKTLEDKLRQEVEQFLRQVQGEEPKKQSPQKKPPVVVQQKPAPRPEPQRRSPRKSIESLVSADMSTADITEHASKLGLEVSHADEKMTAHLQEKFHHQLGAFQESQQPTETRRRQKNEAAAEIAKLMRSPQGVRQAILVSEILRRPDF